MDTKKRLRHDLLQRRSNLSSDEVRQASQRIVDTLIKTIEWPSIGSLHTYIATPQWNEIDTSGLLEYVWQHWPHILTATTRTTGKGMQSAVFDARSEWQTHSWGMPEPKNGQVLTADYRFDLIIVPVVGFDAQNNRLGLGKGYYDRFLATQPTAQKIGLSYRWARVESLPYEPHDIKLDKVIT
jgi:5-formyltetrahydrofolate cyclo-ligase